MKVFDKRVKVGTTVWLKDKVQGLRFHRVTYMHPTRKWVKLTNVEGSFQVAHIERFENKKGLS